MVIQFADADTTDEKAVFANDNTAANMLGKDAVFVLVSAAQEVKALDDTGEAKVKEKAKKTVARKSIVPTSNFEADCLFTAFDAKPGTFVVTDWHGNLSKKFSKAPSIGSIKSAVASAKKDAEKVEKDLAKNAEKAEKAFDKGDHKDALKYSIKVFKEGVAGFEAVENTKLIYESIIEEGRVKLETAKEAGDEKAVKALAKLFRGTDLEDDVKATEKALKAKK